MSNEHFANQAPSKPLAGYQTLRRHPNFWLDDGSLIICIEDDVFKVHRTLLQRHSPLLASWRTDESDPELPDGCTIVSVPKELGAQSGDLQALLEHLYHDSYVSDQKEVAFSVDFSPSPLHADATFPRAAAVLRITSKKQLDFPSIYELARQRVEDMFPSGPRPFYHPGHLHEALELAVEYDISSIQKGLFYSLITTTDLHDDGEPEIQDDAVPNGAVNPAEGLVRLGGDNQLLSAKNLQTAKRLMTAIMDHFTPILFTVATAQHMACTDVFADKWMPLVIQPALENDGVCKPLETLQKIIEVDWETHGLCQSCASEMREEWKDEQQRIWDRIDEWILQSK